MRTSMKMSEGSVRGYELVSALQQGSQRGGMQ
jgi:hypothetical protein